MTEPVFLAGLGIMAITAIQVAKAIGAAIGGRSAARADLTQVKEQLDQHAAALEDAENLLSNQGAQLAELQERLDFAERILAQRKDRGALGSGEQGA